MGTLDHPPDVSDAVCMVPEKAVVPEVEEVDPAVAKDNTSALVDETTTDGLGEESISKSSTLPPIVLKCPECTFLCTSNNQMCRHIFMTFHCVTKCEECDMHLLIWTYCPGVVKMLQRARKDGLIMNITSIETPEKHANRTHHRRTVGTVWTREQFIHHGVPIDYGLVSLPRSGSAPSHVGNKFHCPVCRRVISTWTQMTKHLDATNHSLARCAQCDLPMKCYSMNQPVKHERLTGHRGLIGYFRTREDYVLLDQAPTGDEQYGKIPQFQCPRCTVSFFHTAYLAQHMIAADHDVHRVQGVPIPKCLDCQVDLPLDKMEGHQREKNHIGLVMDITSDFAQSHIMYPRATTESGGDKATQGFVDHRDGGVRQMVVTSLGGNNKVMYQCPECVAIFSSWTKMEKHIFFTKHSLPKCAQCGVHLRPRGWNSPEDHAAITGHQGLVGVVRKKFEYEVTVDMNDKELAELIDDPNNLPTKSSAQAADDGLEEDSHIVFQCPLESCLEVYLSWVHLEKHFSTVHHGFLRCVTCNEEMAPWKPQCEEIHQATFGHAFLAPPEVELKTHIEDYQVMITDSELFTYYGDKFQRCPKCAQILDVSMLATHEGGRRCQKNQDRLKLEKLQAQRRATQVSACKETNTRTKKRTSKSTGCSATNAQGATGSSSSNPGASNVSGKMIGASSVPIVDAGVPCSLHVSKDASMEQKKTHACGSNNHSNSMSSSTSTNNNNNNSMATRNNASYSAPIYHVHEAMGSYNKVGPTGVQPLAPTLPPLSPLSSTVTSSSLRFSAREFTPVPHTGSVPTPCSPIPLATFNSAAAVPTMYYSTPARHEPTRVLTGSEVVHQRPHEDVILVQMLYAPHNAAQVQHYGIPQHAGPMMNGNMAHHTGSPTTMMPHRTFFQGNMYDPCNPYIRY